VSNAVTVMFVIT